MDVLNSILKSVKLCSSMYFNTSFCAPWGVDLAEDYRSSFHIVERGHCWLRMDGREPLQLNEGDIVILPHGSAHLMSDQPNSACRPVADVVGDLMQGVSPFPGEGDGLKMICGFFEFNKDGEVHFLKSLPDLIHFTQQHRTQFQFLDSALEMISHESSSPFPIGGLLKDKITELLFIQAVHTFMELNPERNCYIVALNDRYISQALALMIEQPQYPWTLNKLALKIGMSRSRFAQHFHQLMGTTPMRYLLNCRMQLAKQYIETGNMPISNINEMVGYASDSAFKKAFKEFFGNTPSFYRREMREQLVL